MMGDDTHTPLVYIDPDDEGLAAAERERSLQEENERLRGKCNRLIRALDEFDDSEKPIGESWDEAWIHLAIDDLTSEPHGAASEGEGE